VAVEEIGSSVKGIRPINRRKTSLEQKRAHDIIDGAKSALSPPVLLRGVWARHPKGNPVSEEERAGRGMIKFTAVIALNCLDSGVKLCARI